MPKIMLLDSERDTRPRAVDFTEEELKSLLGTFCFTGCTHTPGKKCPERMGPAWSPGITNGQRGNANVESMEVLAFDLDHLNQDQVVTLDQVITPLKYVLHTTHSHDPERDDFCFRLVLFPDRPVSKHEIRAVRAAVVASLNLPADIATTDEARIYFLPSVSRSGAKPHFSFNEGALLEVGTLLKFKPVEVTRVSEGARDLPAVAPSAEPVDMDPLRARALAAAKGDLRPLVKRAITGEKLADVGARDSILNRVCSSIGFTLSDAPVEAILEIIRESVNAMEPPEKGDWLDIAREKLERARVRSEKLMAQKLENQEVLASIFRADAAQADPTKETEGETPVINAEPYDAVTIEQWAVQQGTDFEGFARRWVIQHGGGYFFFSGGKYATVLCREDAEVSVFRDLSRAPVSLFTQDKNGNKTPRTLKAIVLDYGTVARSIRSSLVLQESFYDATHQEFNEAVCPLRPIKPTFDAEVDAYLRLFGGHQSEKFLDWCALVPDLNFPLCALYMRGEKNTGKTLFAQSISRLWTTGSPSKLTDALASFNDTLTRNPFCFADEQLPKTDTVINDLREFIGNADRSLNRKFMNTASLHGSVRLFIAANNDGLLADARASVTQSDVAALVDRILFIDHGDAPTKFLEGILKEKGPSYIDTFKSQDRLAKHVLWLAENRKVKRDGRFGVRGMQTDFHEQLVTDIENVSNVLEFIVRFMCSKTYVPMPNLVAGGGKLLVNTELVASKDYWEKFIVSRKTPTAKNASTALNALSDTLPVTVDGVQFSSLNVGLVLRWAKRRQVGNVSRLAEMIGVPYEQ